MLAGYSINPWRQEVTCIVSVAKVEKVLLSNDNKVRGATIKYFINGKAVVINGPINKFYPNEPVKQTSADIQPKFVDDTKICQIETS